MNKVVLLSVFLLLFFIGGCRVINGHVSVRGGYNVPPVHAPAHGYRQQHHYWYYPEAEFYFDIDRNIYFYLTSSGNWTSSIYLPFHLKSALHSGYVEIEMEYARPYLQHPHHKNKYKNYRSSKGHHNQKRQKREQHKRYKKIHKDKKGKYEDEHPRRGRGYGQH